MRIKIGGTYRFDYPAEFTSFPEYTAHAGQPVTVLRKLGPDEADVELDMFEVRAADGWTGSSHKVELTRIPKVLPLGAKLP